MMRTNILPRLPGGELQSSATSSCPTPCEVSSAYDVERLWSCDQIENIVGNCSSFDFCHDPTRQEDDGKHQDLVHEVADGLVAALRQSAYEGGLGKHQGRDQYDENQESPAHP